MSLHSVSSRVGPAPAGHRPRASTALTSTFSVVANRRIGPPPPIEASASRGLPSRGGLLRSDDGGGSMLEFLDPIEVTVPGPKRPPELNWVGGQPVIVHYGNVPESDITVHGGIRVTTPLRTVIDLAP